MPREITLGLYHAQIQHCSISDHNGHFVNSISAFLKCVQNSQPLDCNTIGFASIDANTRQSPQWNLCRVFLCRNPSASYGYAGDKSPVMLLLSEDNLEVLEDDFVDRIKDFLL